MGREERSRRGKLRRNRPKTSYKNDDFDYDDRERSLRHNVESHGLYIVPTDPDGNCMFRAISDQVYGNDSHYKELRSQITDYLIQHKDEFAAFVIGNFDSYINMMKKNREFGTQLELAAYSKMKATEIWIFRPDTTYIMHSENKKHIIYLAYHDHEHYSSIRNKDGPHGGLPMIKIQNKDLPSPPKRPTNALPNSTEKAIMSSTAASLELIRQLMKKHKSDHNKVTNILLEGSSGTSSSQDSSSTNTSSISSPVIASSSSLPNSLINKRHSSQKNKINSIISTKISSSNQLSSKSPTDSSQSSSSIPQQFTSRKKKRLERKRKLQRKTENLKALTSKSKPDIQSNHARIDTPIYV